MEYVTWCGVEQLALYVQATVFGERFELIGHDGWPLDVRDHATGDGTRVRM